MKSFAQKVLPPLGAVALAAVVAHFAFHSPPDLTGVVSDLPRLFQGEWAFPEDAAMGLLTAVVMWFGASGVGHLVLYRSGAARCLPTLWGRWVFAPLVGWVFLSLGILLLGLAGLAVRWALGTLMTLAAVAAVWGWRLLVAELRPALEIEVGEEEDEDAAELRLAEAASRSAGPLGRFHFTGVAFFIIGGLYLLVVPYALTPAVESDELRYHLAAPAHWLQSGRIEPIPHQAFSNFPFLVEMLYLMAMSLQGGEGARLVHLTFLESCGILVALLGYLLVRADARRVVEARRRAGVEIAGLMGLGFAVIPCATILGAWAFVDLAMAAYFLAVVYLAALALAGVARPPAWLLGLMIGGAMGIKYSMAPLMAAMLGLLLIAGWIRGGGRWRHDRPVGFRYVLAAGLVGLAVASPWYIRNLVWTGNPFYPLAWSLFGGGDWSESNAAFYAAKAAEKGLRATELYDMAAGRGWLLPILREPGPGRVIEFLFSPLTTSLLPERFEGHFLGAVPLAAMVLALLGVAARLLGGPSDSGGRFANAASRRALALWIAGVTAGSWLFWFLTYQSNRMLLPTLGIVLACGAWGWSRLSDDEGALPAPRAMRAVLLAGCLYAFLFTACALLGSTERDLRLAGREWRIGSERFGRPLAVAFGFEAPEDYLARRLGYYNSARALNDLLGPDARAILIGEHRTMYFEGGVIASDWFDTPQPLPLIRATRDNEDLLNSLESGKVRYIFCNWDELRLYARRYFFPRFTPDELARFEALTGFSGGQPDPRLREVHRDPDREIIIYEILRGDRTKAR